MLFRPLNWYGPLKVGKYKQFGCFMSKRTLIKPTQPFLGKALWYTIYKRTNFESTLKVYHAGEKNCSHKSSGLTKNEILAKLEWNSTSRLHWWKIFYQLNEKFHLEIIVLNRVMNFWLQTLTKQVFYKWWYFEYR